MTGWLAANMVWASAMLLLVLALRGPTARLFGAGAAYALWLLPPLRLVMPPLALPGAAELLPPIDLVLALPAAGAAPLSQDGAAQWTGLLLALWAAGAILFLLWQVAAYREFLRRISLDSRSAGAHRGLPLIESGAVDGPLAMGLLDRRILVPADFSSRYGADERRLALDHERRHHVRGDIWWNLAALLFLALNWFNPIAWLAFRAFRADQELACDAAVLAGAAPAERHAYASAMVKSASRPGLVTACPLNHADQLKRRLKMMKSHDKSRVRRLAGIASVALIGAAGLALGAPGIAQEGGAKQERRERVIIMDKAGEVRAGDGDRVVRIRRGEGGSIDLPRNCDSGDALADIDETSGERRTRILLCHRGGEASAASRVEALERARARIAENDELGPDHRARVLAALDRAIAQARSQ